MDGLYVSAQLEQLHSRYTGTGNADISRYEWLCTQHRDTYSSYIGHRYLQRYIALAQNECVNRVQCEFYQLMVNPCGSPPVSNTVEAFIDRQKHYLQNGSGLSTEENGEESSIMSEDEKY